MFKNLVTFVTGGASGMGRATVKRFAEKGSKVIFCDIQESIGHKTAEEIGSNVHFIPADVRKAEDIKQVLDQIEAKYGKLNTVINCAGIGNAYLIYNFNKNLPRRLDDFTKIIQTNLFGTFNVINQSVKLMAKNEPDPNGLRGIVISTAGIEGVRGVCGQSATAAASNGILKMTKPLARNYHKQCIRVVTISPGLIRTPIVDSLPISIQKQLAAHCHLAPNHPGDPDHFAYMAQAIVLNPHINATNVDISCGFDANTCIF